MTSLSFLRQILHDVRHQKLRTLLTLFGITWGTVSVSLLVAFGEGLEARMLLMEAVRDGRPGMKVEPPLYVYREGSDEYTDEVAEIYAAT